jgi:RNA polymerase sigma factor (sigma-70 family)
MRPRQNITEMFSTFAQLEGNKFSIWVTDINLRRNIQSCLDSSPELANSENFWALYWYKSWQSNFNNLAKMHLEAYLQEPFYRASEKMSAKHASSQYGIADYFQIANAEVEAILKDFNVEKSYNLKYYAVMAVSSRLREVLRQRKEANICTNWVLLRKVSKKIVLEALNSAGLSETAIAQHRLALTCFKELYIYQSSGTDKLPEPNRQLWSAITDLYNRTRQTQLGFSTAECTSDKIEQWLAQTASYIRAYLFPSVKSLDVWVTNSEDEEMLDIPDPKSNSLLADMITQENIEDREQQVAQMSGVILNALHLLDTESQEVLRLYYQEGLTQQQITQRLQRSQPTVSRRLVKGRESLLTAIVKWRLSLNIDLNNCVNSTLIEDMSIALEEYLRNCYGDLNVTK